MDRDPSIACDCVMPRAQPLVTPPPTPAAAHEGALFGVLNVALGLFTFSLMGVNTACVSKYAENTQLNSSKPPNDETMLGIAVATMVPSIEPMNMESMRVTRDTSQSPRS